MAELLERLAAARFAVQQSGQLLLNPSPEVLDSCTKTLSQAIAELADIRPSLHAAQGDGRLLEAARQLQREAQLAGFLLDNANLYYAQWARILSTMIAGYAVGGEAPAVARPGRLAVEG